MASPAIIINVDSKATLRALALSPAKISAGIERAIKKCAYVVERYAKQASPVVTGRLRASIAADISPTVAVIEPHTNYAEFVEEKRHFMKQAGEQSINDVQQIFDDTIKDVVDLL